MFNKPQQRQQRVHYQTNVLMSGTMAVHERYKSWYTFRCLGNVNQDSQLVTFLLRVLENREIRCFNGSQLLGNWLNLSKTLNKCAWWSMIFLAHASLWLPFTMWITLSLFKFFMIVEAYCFMRLAIKVWHYIMKWKNEMKSVKKRNIITINIWIKILIVFPFDARVIVHDRISYSRLSYTGSTHISRFFLRLFSS